MQVKSGYQELNSEINKLRADLANNLSLKYKLKPEQDILVGILN